MGKKLVTERVVSVVERTCYIGEKDGVKHRIGMTNTGRIILMDHSWHEVKLMRAMVRPRSCCYDYVIGRNVAGATVERAFIPYRFKGLTQPVVEQVVVTKYLGSLKHKAHTIIETAISLSGGGPYQAYMQMPLTYQRSVSDSTPAHDKRPCWANIPHGRTHGGHLSICYNMKMVVDIIKNPDTLGVKFPVDKVSRQDSYTHDQTRTYIREDQPYLLPIIMEHRSGDARVVRGMLVDPNMTALSRRIRWARAVITPAGITFMSIEDLEVS